MFGDLLNKVATVQRRVASADGYSTGNSANSDWVTVPDLEVPCRVTRQSSINRFRNPSTGPDLSTDSMLLFTDYRTDLTDRDRFVIADADGGNPQVYESEDMDDPELMHHHLEFTVRRIT